MSDWYVCKECGYETDFPPHPPDGPDFCPGCRSIDSFECADEDVETSKPPAPGGNEDE